MLFGNQNLVTVSYCLPLNHILTHIDPVHILASYVFKINFSIILPSLPRTPNWSLLLRCPQSKILYANIICTTHATCNTHFILLDLNRLVTYYTRYKLWGFSYNLLQSRNTSSIIGPNIFLSTLFSNTLNPLCSPLTFIHAKGKVKM
jgi:hypothetical protein